MNHMCSTAVFLPAVRYEYTGQWMIFGFLFLLLFRRFVKYSNILAREALETGTLVIEVTEFKFEVTGISWVI